MFFQRFEKLCFSKPLQIFDLKSDHKETGYIFHLEGNVWKQFQKLTVIDGTSGDAFGYSVSIDGNYAIIGARSNDNSGSNSGCAYIFSFDGENWIRQQKIAPSDGEKDDGFGHSVSIKNDYVIVGVQQDNDNGFWSGSAYIFRLDGETWIQHSKLKASDGTDNEKFGHSVSIDNNYAVVGTHYYDDSGPVSGFAYVY